MNETDNNKLVLKKCKVQCKSLKAVSLNVIKLLRKIKIDKFQFPQNISKLKKVRMNLK